MFIDCLRSYHSVCRFFDEQRTIVQGCSSLFISVECQYNNNKTTIGTVEFAKINFAEEHSFYFVDSTFYKEVGSKTYRVIGVMTDQSSLIYSNSVIASKHFNVSSEFLNLSLDYLGMGV